MTAGNHVRSVAQVSFTGLLSIDLLTNYTAPVRLRETIDGVDSGFFSFRGFDPSSLPPGNGYLVHIFDQEDGTLLATGTAAQRGVRATIELAMTAVPLDTASITITFPDMSDESAVLTTESQTYVFAAAGPLPLTAANEVLIVAGDITATIDNFVSAINGSADYMSASLGPDTASCQELIAKRTSLTEFSIEARQGGTWGNRITYDVATGTTNITPTTAYGSGGTGNHGLLISFPKTELLASLITPPATTRNCHVEVFGLDDTNNPSKLVTGPGLLHVSSVVLP